MAHHAHSISVRAICLTTLWLLLIFVGIGCGSSQTATASRGDVNLSPTELWRQGLGKAENRDFAGALADISTANRIESLPKYEVAIAHLTFLCKDYKEAVKKYKALVSSGKLERAKQTSLEAEIQRIESMGSEVTGVSLAGNWVRATVAEVAAEEAIEQNNYEVACKSYDKAYQYSQEFSFLLESALAASRAGQWDWANKKFKEYMAVGGDEVSREMAYRIVAEIDRIAALTKGEVVVTDRSLAEEIYAERRGDEQADGLPPSMLAQMDTDTDGNAIDATVTEPDTGFSSDGRIAETKVDTAADGAVDAVPSAAATTDESGESAEAQALRRKREDAATREQEAKERRLALQAELDEKRRLKAEEAQRIADERKAKAELARAEKAARDAKKKAEQEAQEAQRQEARRLAMEEKANAKAAQEQTAAEREALIEQQRLDRLAQAEEKKRAREEKKRAQAEERERLAEEKRQRAEEKKRQAAQQRLEREENLRIAKAERAAAREEKKAQDEKRRMEQELAKQELQFAAALKKQQRDAAKEEKRAAKQPSQNGPGDQQGGGQKRASAAASSVTSTKGATAARQPVVNKAEAPETTLEDLQFYAQSKSATVRFRAVKELIAVYGRSARAVLESRVLEDRNMHVRFLAVSGLVQQRSVQSLSVLEQAVLTAATSQERAVLKNAIAEIRLGGK